MKRGLQSGLLSALLLIAPVSAFAGDGPDAAPSVEEAPLSKAAERRAKREARRAKKRAAKRERERQMKPQKEARAFRKLKVEDPQARVDKLTNELTWHPTLAAAKAEARKQDKPILYIQALGDLSGLL